jgi:hypothetical protein
MKKISKGVVFLAAGALLAVLGREALAGGPYEYYAVTPCRVVDTRQPPASPISTSAFRSFTIKGFCGIPSDAAAVTFNLTVVGPTQSGFLNIWPSNVSPPNVSTINFVASEPALANGAIVPLAVSPPEVTVAYGLSGGSGSATLNLILDVTGYFK